MDKSVDFKAAAHVLGAQVTTAEMAEALGVSPHSIRQARLLEGTAGYRKPPEGWQVAMIGLAQQRVDQLSALIDALERERPTNAAPQAEARDTR